LSLGYITRIETHAGRQEPRGQGLELRTDGHGAIRAKAGLLISTEARPQAQAHITDMAETTGRLSQSDELQDSLGQAALQATAQTAGDQDEVVKALKADSLSLKGQALKGQGATPSKGEFAEFQAPHLTIASPAGIQTTAQGNTHFSSTEHMALTSGGHTSVSTGKSWLVSAKNAVRLFAHKLGMKLVAAQGDIDITALKDSINLLAKLNITHTANRISIMAKEEVLINGGTSFTKWSAAGIEHGTQGVWKHQVGGSSVTGPKSAPGPTLPEPVTLAEVEIKHRLALNLNSHADGAQRFAHEPYELYKGGACIDQGMTDEAGGLVVEDHRLGTPAYRVKLKNDTWVEVNVNAELERTNALQQRANQGFRGVQGGGQGSSSYGHDDEAADDDIQA
jgi:type VI secretion system secreted protein VgrG